MNKCKICEIELKSSKAKVCSNKACKSKWKIIRNKNLDPIEKICQLCGKSFKTIDRRNNFCSTDCKITQTHNTKLKIYGKKSISNPNPEKTQITMKERYEINPHRLRFLQQRGFSNLEDFIKAVKDFCEKEGVAPSSNYCLEYFNMSTAILSKLKEAGHGHLLHNSYRQSTQEKEIAQFLVNELNLEIETNIRPNFLDKKEIDIYIKDKKVGIEHHGLFHHSERPTFYDKDIYKIKKNHEFKYVKCKENNVKLIQIFEDEWRDKKDILKSMIKNKVGLFDYKIGARELIIKEVSNKESNLFFEENHISGSTKSIKSFGLYNKAGLLICCISLRKPWSKKYGNDVVEIARFASLKNHSIIGGFSKLMKEVKKYCKEVEIGRILTYADCRFGSGGVYLNYGFNYLGKTKPNYFYEKRGIREGRFKHRKNIVLEGNTEREQQNKLGWYAIYDAGNEIYLLNINKTGTDL